MERREVLHKCLGAAALAFVPPMMDHPTKNGGSQNKSEFQETWEEACLCHCWFEDRRAYDLALRALALAPENLDIRVRADIVEKLTNLRAVLAAAEEDLPKQREALKADPDDPEKHFFLGFTLNRLGRDEEALAEYRSALRNPQWLCADCHRDARNNIGWYYYRKGHYQQAMEWFDGAIERADCCRVLGEADAVKAIENKILTYAAMGDIPKAQETARGYIKRFGRLPWPESRALAKIGIDADTMYIQFYGHTLGECDSQDHEASMRGNLHDRDCPEGYIWNRCT